MKSTKVCEKCGAALPEDAPYGICPKCLMQLGMETNAKTAGEERGTGSHRKVAPPPAEIAAHFPQLDVLEILGQGGMGIVYKARQPKLNRLVALKILPVEFGADAAFAERFNREACALAKLSHPGIVSVFDFGKAGPYYYLLMEYVDGLNLRELTQSRQIGTAEALEIVRKICEALQYAHDEGIVHRDIKPANILIDRKGRVKIADFGLAKLLGHAPEEPALTGTAQVMGTPHYMAPEQVRGDREIDHRADIYSLGVVLYEILTGELPLGRFEPPSRKVQVDVRLDEVVFRALEREPDRRYQHASEVKTEVEQITTTEGRKVVPPQIRSGGGFAGERRVSVKGPGIALIATGILNWLGNIVALLVLAYWSAATDQLEAPRWMVAVWVFLSLLIMVATALMVAGGIKMIRFEAYGLAVTASVLAMVLTPGNVVGLVIGIWAFVVLLRPEVKAAFEERKALRAAEKR